MILMLFEILAILSRLDYQYSGVRFLSIYIVVVRIIEQYKPLKELFLVTIPKYHSKVRKQSRVRRITEMMRNIYTLPTLHFMTFALKIYQIYELIFQKNEPTIHLLYDQQVDIFRNTLLMYCKFDSVAALLTDADLVNFDFKNEKYHIHVRSISIGEKTIRFVKKMSDNECTIFMAGVKRYYIEITRCLLKNLSLRSSILADLRFLSPSNRNIKSEKQIKGIAKKLPPSCQIEDGEIDLLCIEWKQLVLESIPTEWTEDDDMPIDIYWTYIFGIKISNQLKYPTIKKVVQCCLSFAEANAAVERQFSQLAHIISKDRSRLDENTIKGLMACKSTMAANNKSCYNFPTNDEMIVHSLSARSRYVARLAEKRKIVEALDDEELEREIQKKQDENREKAKKLKQIQENEEKIVVKEKKFSEKHLEAIKLLKQAQELMKETQNLKEEIDAERNEVQKQKKSLTYKSKTKKSSKLDRFQSFLDNNNEMPSTSKK